MTLYGYARVSVREPEDKNLDLLYSSRHARGSNRRAITLIWGIPVKITTRPLPSTDNPKIGIKDCRLHTLACPRVT